MFELLLHIGTDEQHEIAFTISEADLEAAISTDCINAADPFEKQIRCAAVCRAAELGAFGDDHAWALVDGEQTIVMNESALRFVRHYLV